MYDNNDPRQELSVAQSGSQQSGGCPVCGGPIHAVERHGGEVSVAPCGHDITDVQASALAAPERSTERKLAADGGQATQADGDARDDYPTDVTVLERQDGYVCIKTNPDSAMGRRTLILKPEELESLRDELGVDGGDA